LLEQLFALPPSAHTQLTKSVQAVSAVEISLLHLLSTHDPQAALPDDWVNALHVEGVPADPAEEHAAIVAASAPNPKDRNQDIIMGILRCGAAWDASREWSAAERSHGKGVFLLTRPGALHGLRAFGAEAAKWIG
jgi:hypothetical protein